MTTELEDLVAKVKGLAPDELLTIQETITAELRRLIVPEGNGNANSANAINAKRPDTAEEREAILRRYFRPQPTKEELEESLKRIFPPEVMAVMGHTDFNRLPIGTKSLSAMVIEDREDRL